MIARLVLVLALVGCARAPMHARLPERTFVVATYNLNYGIAGDPETLAAIRDTDADVLVLQEVSDAWADALDGALAREWPHRCGVQSDWPAGGGAIRSRFPLEACARSPSAAGGFPALAATVRSPLGRVRVIDVHLRPARAGVEVLADLPALPDAHRAELAAHLARLGDPALPTIVAGDFNEGDGEGAVGELAARGWASAVARRAPGAVTWRWPLGAMSLEKRLDHVLYTPEGLACVAASVRRAGRSDHLPVVARFARAEPPMRSYGSLRTATSMR